MSFGVFPENSSKFGNSIVPKLCMFLAVHNSSIGDLVTNSLTDSLTFTFDITE